MPTALLEIVAFAGLVPVALPPFAAASSAARSAVVFVRLEFVVAAAAAVAVVVGLPPMVVRLVRERKWQ